MKHLLLILTMIPAIALAEPMSFERTLKDTTTIVALDLNPYTVFCTARGYSSVQLKISVLDLDWLAHFDHRVVGETLPCITGGACNEKLQPGVLIDPKDPIVLAPMRVVLKEVITIDEAAQTCTHTLYENVSGLVRGYPFEHQKNSADEPLLIDQCLKLSDAHQ